MRQRRPRIDETNHDRRRRRRPRMRRLLAVPLAAGLLGLGAAGAWGADAGTQPRDVPGPATTTLPGTLLEGGFTDDGATRLFAYAAAGDEVVARIASTARTPAGARVVVTDPTGLVVHDDAVPAAVAGTHVGGAWTAASEGVWTIAVVDPFVGTGGEASLAWDVAVVRGGASIPGRVWTESLAIHTPDSTTIEVFAAAPDGALYRVTLDGYDGVDSTLRVNDVGNAARGTCEPALRSVPMPHSPEADGAAWWQPTDAQCEGLTDFRLFIDPPAADLPAATTAWADGRTDDTWLAATYAPPSIDALAFARETVASNAGVLSGSLLGQPGVVRVEVDADGDGGFDGPLDVADDVAVLEPGPFAWRWDGLDASGAASPVTTTGIALRATMAQVSPVHVVRIDAETSAGGIEVEVLTGPEPGIATLHWDDTALEASSSSRWTRTPALVGSDPATTSAGGVHGWDAGGERPNQNDGRTGSWGDLRAIDDWAFIEDHAQAVVSLAALPDLRIDKRVDVELPAADDGSAATVTWTIDVGNLGPVEATAVTVVDDYPAELDVASVRVVGGPSQGAFDATSGLWSLGSLASGAVASVTLQGTVSTTPGAAATVANAASVSSPQTPPSPGTCTPNADLASDDDRCDVVETPLVPVVAAPPAEPTPAAAPVPRPALRDPGRREPLPETGASVHPLVGVGGALALSIGVAALALRHRARGGREG